MAAAVVIRVPSSAVGEDINVLPARQVQGRAVRKVVEGRPRQAHAALALEHDIELFTQGVQVQHVRGRVGHLVGAERLRAPVRRLLSLGQFHAQQLARHVLQAVAVGIGAGQLRGDLGAVDGRGHDSQMEFEHGDIKAAEVKKLQYGRIGQQRLQVGAVVAGALETDDMGVAVAGRQLDHAQRIAAQAQAHGLRIDRDDGRAGEHAVGKVAFVNKIGQVSEFSAGLRRVERSRRISRPI